MASPEIPPRHSITETSEAPPYLNQVFREGTPLILRNFDGRDHPIPLLPPQSGVSVRDIRDLLQEGEQRWSGRTRWVWGRGCRERYLQGAPAPHGDPRAAGIPGSHGQRPDVGLLDVIQHRAAS